MYTQKKVLISFQEFFLMLRDVTTVSLCVKLVSFTVLRNDKVVMIEALMEICLHRGIWEC